MIILNSVYIFTTIKSTSSSVINGNSESATLDTNNASKIEIKSEQTYEDIAHSSKNQTKYVEEKIIHGAGFNKSSNIKATVLKRAVLRENGIELRSSADGGSIITFSRLNPVRNWSFEFTINELDLSFPEQAGIYLWYTNEPLTDGLYKGADSNFTGIMIGLEFFGRYLEITLVTGNNNRKSPLEILRDSVNPERLRDAIGLTAKVISTDRNFKVELYVQNKIVYDSLRIINTHILGDLNAGKYFSITTTYHNVPLEKHFLLNKASLYERTEHLTYDPLEMKSNVPQIKHREINEINYPNKEVQHLISNIEHFMRFVHVMLGRPTGSNIMQTMIDIKNAGIKHNELLGLIKKESRALVQSKKPTSLLSLNERVKNLNMQLLGIEKTLDEFTDILKEIDANNTKRAKGLMLVMAIGIIGVFWVYHKKRKNAGEEVKKT